MKQLLSLLARASFSFPDFLQNKHVCMQYKHGTV